MKLLVQESLEVPGVLGSKMMGYGYGGCLITLIERHSARTLELHLKKRSQEEFKQECSCYVCPIPSGGAGDCHSPDLQTNSSLLKRYQPELLPEEKGDLLTKKLIPFVIAFGILVGIISAMVVLRREKSLED